jgi:hypothetical protein
MYYFGYCTYLLDAERAKYLPEAKTITKASVANHEIQFRSASGREDRGWCHLADRGSARGKTAQGMVYEVDDDRVNDDFDDFDIVFLTVKGEDGNYYDCMTYVLTQPGKRMRPPRFYWERVPSGFREQKFAEDYVQSIEKTFDQAAECPDFERPMPSATPGRSADSR